MGGGVWVGVGAGVCGGGGVGGGGCDGRGVCVLVTCVSLSELQWGQPG